LLGRQADQDGHIVGHVLASTNGRVRHCRSRVQISECDADAAIAEVDAHDAPGTAGGPVSTNSHQLAVGLAEGETDGVEEGSGDMESLADGVGAVDATVEGSGAMVAVGSGPGPWGAGVELGRGATLPTGEALAWPVGVTT
jgi:hypothetical protein